jgi:hypothetical protein
MKIELYYKIIKAWLSFLCRRTSLVIFLIFIRGYSECYAQSTVTPRLSVALLLDASGGSQNTQDGVVAVFDDRFQSTVGSEDSYKLANADENLAINCDGTLLSIEGRPSVKPGDSLCLEIWRYRYTSYFLRLSGTNFPSTVTAVVRDRYLQHETSFDLSAITIYPFSITTDSASFSRDRFSILFKPAVVLPVTFSNITAYHKEKGIQIDWIANTETGVDNYEIEKANGQQFETIGTLSARARNAVPQNYRWFDPYPVAGNNFYRIKAIERSGVIKFSSIVSAHSEYSKTDLRVFPNPLQGKVIGIQLTNMQKGRYSVALYKSVGQKIFTSIIEHNGILATYTVPLRKQINKGIYRLHLYNKSISLSKIMLVY